MKNYIIYLGLISAGLLIGWLIFDNSDTSVSENNQSNEDSAEQIWTCSMHPQIRQPEPGDCPICGMDLIPLDENAQGDPLIFTMTDEAVKISNIQTTRIGSNQGNNEGMVLSGKIKADETISASIVSHLSGRIDKLYITYTGQQIIKGQKVATIYAPKLIAAQKELLEAYKVREQQPELYEATQNKLKNWKLTDSQIQSILDSKELLETFDIYAEYSGIVLRKNVAVGDHVSEGKVLYDIQNLNKVWAVFDAYESDIEQIHTGESISFYSPSYPDKQFTGTISFIDPLIDPSTRTIAIRANIQNKDLLLKPDMFIEGKIETSSVESTSLFVPKSAVLWTGERSVVYVKVPDLSTPSFEYREIEIGSTSGPYYQVLSGLKSGDEVVTNGAFVIDASAQLNNQASMMNKILLEDQPNELELVPDFQAFVPKDFIIQLNQVVLDYYLIKDALVNDDSEQGIKAAEQLLISLEKVDMNLVKNDAHEYWMQQVETIKKSATDIEHSNSLKTERSAFTDLSIAILNSAKAFGVTTTAYVQFCPMANSKKGGYWLSPSDKILNPYFGSEMLRCGEINDTLINQKSKDK